MGTAKEVHLHFFLAFNYVFLPSLVHGEGWTCRRVWAGLQWSWGAWDVSRDEELSEPWTLACVWALALSLMGSSLKSTASNLFMVMSCASLQGLGCQPPQLREMHSSPLNHSFWLHRMSFPCSFSAAANILFSLGWGGEGFSSGWNRETVFLGFLKLFLYPFPAPQELLWCHWFEDIQEQLERKSESS